MKTIVSILILFLSILSQTQNAPKTDVATITFKVSGNCDQCKERIENAADIKGVKVCTWDIKTHVAKVVYNPSKVTPEQIKQAIANAGHDVEGYKASDKAYKELSDCCKYREGECTKR